jgi:hypothetical protein
MGGMRMSQITDLKAETEGVYTRLNELVRLLSEKRIIEVKARIAHEKAKEDMAIMHRNKVLELSSQLTDVVDPKTGKSNKEFSEMVLHSMMEQDPEYVTALQKMWETQEAQLLAQTESVNVADQLGTTRTAARLLCALLEFAGGSI